MAAAISREWMIFFCISGVFFSVFFFEIDAETFAQWSLRAVFFAGLFSLIYFFIGSWLGNLRNYFQTTSVQTSETPSESRSDQDLQERQQRARATVQESYTQQATEYHERITKPREDAKRKKKEEEYFRFNGPTFKGKADRLGNAESSEAAPAPSRGDRNRGAANSRKFLDEVEKSMKSKAAAAPKPASSKRKLFVPDEPAEGATDCVTVVLRFPSGRPHRRRFLTSHTVQMLLDFMQSVGYHQKIYAIYQTFPRSCISLDADKTLSEVGILRDVALNVEERGTEEDQS